MEDSSSKCKECGGASICEHLRDPWILDLSKECGGASVMDHLVFV